MKKATLDATDENILQSIKEQNITSRNSEIKDFVEALDMIDGNMFISLEARWGEGKTFYVRQIEKTLAYQTMKKFGTDDTKDELDKMKPYFAGTPIEDMDLENSYFPVYYNAWLYDNHTDPLLSLLYVVIKKCGKISNAKFTKEKSDRVKQLLQSIQVNFPFFSINGEQVVNAVSNKNIFEEIQLAEDIRNEVKLILNEVIVERAEKLVIFIDELDRCRPSYALEMLERIKHYFNDKRIIFIVSVNKEQLTHTISNYYGAGFDSTRYLNKFFDLEMYLPNTEGIEKEINIYKNNQYWLINIANELRRYYKLSLRDSLIYNEKIMYLSEDNLIQDQYHNGTYSGIYLSLFVPIAIILDMVDVEERVKFIKGESKILDKIRKLPVIRQFFDRFRTNGFSQIKAIYEFSFGEGEEEILKNVGLSVEEIGYNIKQDCLKRCALKVY